MAQGRISAPLPSWNEGKPKQTIIQFVQDVTNSSSKNYLPLGNRIAVFDNDGTLWQEKPIYVQLAFVIDQIKILAPQHPEWQIEEPFRTLLTVSSPDLKSLSSVENLMKLVLVTYAGMSQTEFETQVKQFFKTAQHPRFKQPYTKLIYQPAIAVGNSDGDIQMLQYTDSNPKPNLELLLNHDDLEREYNYNTETEKALLLAPKNDWIIVSIKEGFKRVFPFSISTTNLSF